MEQPLIPSSVERVQEDTPKIENCLKKHKKWWKGNPRGSDNPASYLVTENKWGAQENIY